MEKVKGYWKQKYFNEDVVSRGVYDYHTVVGVGLLCNGIVRNEKYTNSPLKFVWPFCSFGLAIVSFVLQVMQIYHFLDENNIPDAAENFAFMLTVVGVILQTVCIFFGRNVIQILGDMMDGDFAKMDNSPREYRELFFKHQLLIKRLTIGWIIYISGTIVYFLGKIFLQLIYQQLFAEYTVDSVRPLMFKLWVPMVDVYSTPNYEIFVITQIIIIFCVATVYGSYCLVYLHYNLHILCQFDLVILDWRKLFKFDDLPTMDLNEVKDEEERNFIYDILKKRIKETCIRHRHTLEFFAHVNSLFGPVLFAQLLLGSVSLCLFGFQVVYSVELGQIDLFFLLLFVGCLVQIYVPCFLGSLLLQKASDVGVECYSSGWETMKISKEIKLEILTFLLMANKPVATMALGLQEASLETFTAIIQAAGSYFVTLRHLNKGGL